MISRVEALGSTKPRFWEGIGCEKRRKDSDGDFMLHTSDSPDLFVTDLHEHLPPRRRVSGADLRLSFPLAMLLFQDQGC